MRPPRSVTPEQPGPGQESVWAYPRPAIAETCARRLQVIHRGVTVADTTRGFRALETSHPPTYYFPRDDVDMTLLAPAGRRSLCEWKGGAVYFDVTLAGETLPAAAWSYPSPTGGFAAIRDALAFYPAPFETCLVDGERVTPQPGGFYGGWITSHVAGPFKGGPGTMG